MDLGKLEVGDFVLPYVSSDTIVLTSIFVFLSIREAYEGSIKMTNRGKFPGIDRSRQASLSAHSVGAK